MAFGVNWRSIDGYLTQVFEMPSNLNIIHNDRAEPTGGTTALLDDWNVHDYDNTMIRTIQDFSELQGIEIDPNDARNYFSGTTSSNPKKLCEFVIKDSSLSPTGGRVTWCLRAWANGANLTCENFRIIYGGNGEIITATSISNQRTLPLGDRIKIVAGAFARNLLSLFGVGFYILNLNGGQTEGDIWNVTTSNAQTLFGGSPDGDKFSPEFGKPSQPAGGYLPDGGAHGTFDDSSDVIPVPSLPTVGVTTAGFVNVYRVENGDLQSLGEKLFPHFLPAEILADPAQLTTPQAIAMMLKALYGVMLSPVGTTIELADNLGIIDVLMNGKLIDYVLDCHIIPVSISGATVEGLRVGYRQFNDLQLARATTDYVEVNCGSLSIAEYWGNFLDYSCTVKLFLPFVGFVPIQNEYWNSGTIGVVYHVNIVDGSFQAYVVATSGKSQLTNTVIGQYGGVCCVHLPITGLQYSNVVAGLVNGTAGAVSKGAGGDYGGAVTNAMNTAMLRPDAPMSNGYNASSSFLSERIPYLVIERPCAQFSEIYPTEKGLPLNVTFKLSEVHGFTTIDNPVLNIACSDAEYNELVSLLKSGVIL